MRVILRTIKNRVKEFLDGMMVRYTRDNLKRII
jgi:hypothetical protein